MKFTCDSCNAQYMIADEKVGQRGVKVKCKKCAHVIVVKPLAATDTCGAEADNDSQGGGNGNGGGSAPGDGAKTQMAAPDQMGGAFDSLFGGEGAGAEAGNWGSFGENDAATAAAASTQVQVSAGEKEWYFAVDDALVGPVDLAELQQRWDAREITEDSLAWKAGMPDWNPIAEIPDLAYLVTERPQAVAQQGGQAGPAPGPSGMGAGGLAAGGAPGVVAPVAFSGASASAQVDWKPSAASALSSLVEEELAVPHESAKNEPANERPAGVPDLGGMPGFGASDLFGGGASSGTAAPVGGSFGTQAPPIDSGWSVPQPRRNTSGGLQPIHIFFGLSGVVAVVALAVVVVLLMGRQPATQPQQLAQAQVQAQAMPQNQAQQQVAQQQNTPQGQAAEDKGSDEAGASDKAQTEPRAADKASDGSKRDAGSKAVKKEKVVAKKKEPVSKPKRAAPTRAPAPRKSAKPLGKDDIINTVKKNAASVAPCLKTARSRNEITPGRYKFILDWTIRANGSVGNARLKGPSNVMGSSLPRCFEQVISRWKFPASSDGAPISNFPFGPITVR